MGQRRGAEPCYLPPPQELGQDEGLYGRATLRGTELCHAVPWLGLSSSPPHWFGDLGRELFALFVHLTASFPAADDRAEGEARAKPRENKRRSCREGRQVAQKVPCSPREALGAARPLPRPRWKTQLKTLLHHPPPPRCLLPPAWARNVLGRKKPEVLHVPPGQSTARLWLPLGQERAKAPGAPAPHGDAGAAPGPPAPGYTVTCCSGSSSTSRCLHIPPLLSPLPRNLCHLLADNWGEWHGDERAERSRRQRDPRAGALGGLCLALPSILSAGALGSWAERVAGRHRELGCRRMAAGLH